jgi:hypothetical protein
LVNKTVKQFYKKAFFATVLLNILTVFGFTLLDQQFWNFIFRDYGLKGKWDLVTINLTNQYNYTANWLNGSFIFLLFLSVLNICLAWRTFSETKKLSQEPNSQNNRSS